MSIVNNFSHPVILADDRDADVSWEHHLERKSAGGVDLAYPYGTPVALNTAGHLVFDGSPSGSGGRTATLYIDHPVLAYIQYMHLSEGRSGVFDAGDTPIRSGASGFGSDHGYDPHLHVHAYDKHGVRVNLFHYFDTAGEDPAPAGDNKTPITPTSPEEDDVDDLIYLYSPGVDQGARYLFSRRTGKVVRGIPKAEWDFLTAIGSTAGGAPTSVVTVSENWLRKAQAL